MIRINVLFVCMGNICRSPAAECVFRHIVESEGLSENFNIDSAGTIGFHAGDPPDPRMRQEARNRGILVDGRARQITRDDLSDYDLILAMDKSNLQYLREMDESNGYFEKMRLFCDYVKKFYHSEVPDPYYGGTEGFRLVMDLLEDGCRNLLDELKLELKLKKK